MRRAFSQGSVLRSHPGGSLTKSILTLFNLALSCLVKPEVIFSHHLSVLVLLEISTTVPSLLRAYLVGEEPFCVSKELNNCFNWSKVQGNLNFIKNWRIPKGKKKKNLRIQKGKSLGWAWCSQGLLVLVEGRARSGGMGGIGCGVWAIPFIKTIHMCHLQCVLRQIQFKWTSIYFHFQGKWVCMDSVQAR